MYLYFQPGINQQPEIKICSMAFEENRVESYKDWPFPDSAKCSKLNVSSIILYFLKHKACSQVDIEPDLESS